MPKGRPVASACGYARGDAGMTGFGAVVTALPFFGFLASRPCLSFDIWHSSGGRGRRLLPKVRAAAEPHARTTTPDGCRRAAEFAVQAQPGLREAALLAFRD